MKTKIIILIFFILITFLRNGVSQLSFPLNKNQYSVQMHIHGWSNHNGNDLPGSMQWHSHFADSTKTDVIWWSDHIKIHSQLYTYSFAFNNFYYDSINSKLQSTNNITNLGIPENWPVTKQNCVPKFDLTSAYIRMILKRDDQTKQAFCKIVPRSMADNKLKQLQYFIRPLASEPVISFKIFTTGFDSSALNYFEVKITLNYHHYYGIDEVQKLIYRFAVNATYQQYLYDSSTVITVIPIQDNINNALSLNLKNDAMLLHDGIDNSI